MSERMTDERFAVFQADYNLANGDPQSDEDKIELFEALKAERECVKELEALIRGTNHHPDCKFWKWNWEYSWDVTDCTCSKVGAALGDKA